MISIYSDEMPKFIKLMDNKSKLKILCSGKKTKFKKVFKGNKPYFRTQTQIQNRIEGW